jgi:nucleotide-binding universal stress UspA family protein
MPGILVGIDGSPHAKRALEWAVNEASIRHVPLTVLTVHQAVMGYFGGPVSYPGDADIETRARNAAEQETNAILAHYDAASRPPSVTVKSVTGLPAEEILNAAATADLVVVGSRGAGGFKRLLMGSVSTQVTHHARVPVVVLPTDADNG